MTKEDLINKGFLNVDASGKVTCSHNVRLMTYLEGKIPDFSKKSCTDAFARDWGMTCARLCNALIVSFREIEKFYFHYS